MISCLDLLLRFLCKSTSTKILYQLKRDLKRFLLAQGVTASKTWADGTNGMNSARLTLLQFLYATATMLQQ